MKPAVLLNPRSNAGRGLPRWKAFLETPVAREAGLAGAPVFDGGGLAPEPDGTFPALDAWIGARLAEGRSDFVAAGGDGTVNLLLNALIRSGAAAGSVRLGAVGIGSSNDFHKPRTAPGRGWAAGVPCRLDFRAARPHDVGRVILTGAGGAPLMRHFIVNASLGVTAEANARFNGAGPALRLLKRAWVDGAILVAALSTFATYRNAEVELRVGSGRRRLALTNLGVVKNAHFSGSFRYDSAPAPDDGLFGVHGCVGMGRMAMVRSLARLSRGRLAGTPGTFSEEAPALEVVSTGRALAVETDGEVIRARSASFEALRGRILACP